MSTTKTILITGGTGAVGRRLIPHLLNRGYVVHVLSRKKKNIAHVKVFLWDYEKRFIDEKAFENVTHIIHLAGESIISKRWTDVWKKQLIRSRVMSAQLLENYILKNNISIEKFISASGVGFYGTSNQEYVYTEEDPAGRDFLATCCIKWEEAATDFQPICPVVRIRLAVILDKQSGFFPKFTMPIKLGLGAAFGNGKQPIPWIHMNDVCAIFCKAIDDETMVGVYNAVAPEIHSNFSFNKTCAEIMRRPFFLPKIPAFMLKLLLGEMSETLLYGQKVSSQKLLQANFKFQFASLRNAIEDLIK